MTLVELTNHDAGIIVYESGAVAVLFWVELDDDCLPSYGPMGIRISFWSEKGIFDDAEFERVSDVRKAIPGSVWVESDGYHTDLDIMEDDSHDLIRLFTDATLGPDDYEGVVYTLKDGTKIITLDMWV